MVTTVLVAEHYTLIRQGLVRVLRADTRLNVVGEAENGLDAVTKVQNLRPDVVLMNVALPGVDGIAATRRIRRETPETQVILLSMAVNEEPDILEMVSAGARGFVTLDADASRVVRYIEQVVAGKTGISEELTGKLLESLARGTHLRNTSGDNDMSRRERDVLRLIAEGASNKEIASALFVSENTVRAHVRNLMHKIGADNRTQLAIYAVRNGIGPEVRGRSLVGAGSRAA